MPVRVRVSARAPAAAGTGRERHGRAALLCRRGRGPPGRGDRAAGERQRPVLRAVHVAAQADVPAVAAGPPGRGDPGRPGRARIQRALKRPPPARKNLTISRMTLWITVTPRRGLAEPWG